MRPSLVCASWVIFIRSTDFRATLEYNVREKWCIGEREKEMVEGGEESKRELVSKRKEEIMEMQRNMKLKGRDDCIQHLLTTVKCKCQAVSCVCMWGGQSYTFTALSCFVPTPPPAHTADLSLTLELPRCTVPGVSGHFTPSDL